MKKILSEAFSVNLIIVLMLFALGSYSFGGNVQTFAENKAIYKSDTQEKKVCLMINVYGNTEETEKLLKIFEQAKIKATFFIGGVWAEKNRETVKKIDDGGHTLGNHGYNHKLHTKLNRDENIKEITLTGNIIKEVTGKNCTLFAPPAGDVNSSVVNYAGECGYKTVMWSCDTIDWRDRDTEKIMARIKRNLTAGAFILMHPTPASVEIMPEIISYVQNEGYVFETVDSLI